MYPTMRLRSLLSRWCDALLALALAGPWSGPVAADTLVAVGTYTWQTQAIVGLSGLEVSEDGLTLMAISDRGWFLSGTFERRDGRIAGIMIRELLPILGNDGLPVAARRVGDWSDAEGLAMAPDGTYWISFERWAHVARYEAPGLAGHWIRDHPDFSRFEDNRQLEALALHPDGTLYAFPEQPLGPGFPIFRLAENGWEVAGHIPQQDGFAIVGADFAADGRLYLLERKLVLGLWWQNRIRRLRVEAPEAGEMLWTGERGAYHDLEGIAVWSAPDGLRLTLISDDNGEQVEPTQFVEFRLVTDSESISRNR